MSAKNNSKRDWAISIVITVLILAVGGYFYYKNNKPTPQPLGPHGEKPEVVEYIKKKLADPNSFRHISTVMISKPNYNPTYVMKFKYLSGTDTLINSAYAVCDDETGEVIECKVINGMD